MPRLEALGLADGLFFHVLEHCVRVQHALAAHAHPVPIGVNASAQTLSRPGTIERVESIVREARIAPASISLELTEDSPVPDATQLIIALNRLRLLGHPLAIDDFGVGYSSFAYLRELPVDRFKLDRSFLTQVPHSPGDSRLVGALIAMGHRLEVAIEEFFDDIVADRDRVAEKSLALQGAQVLDDAVE